MGSQLIRRTSVILMPLVLVSLGCQSAQSRPLWPGFGTVFKEACSGFVQDMADRPESQSNLIGHQQIERDTIDQNVHAMP